MARLDRIVGAAMLGAIFLDIAKRQRTSTKTGIGEAKLPSMTNSAAPRGIRNNNPGNIEKGDNWRGLSRDQSSDARFAVFNAPVWGIRAIARLLKNYGARHGIDTVRGAINRWAPPHENDTSAYVNAVAQRVGVSPDSRISLSNPATLTRIIPAIIQHENGQQPYSLELISEAIALA